MRIHPADRKSTVLVVESNLEMNQFITECLADHYHVISALDSKQGLEKAVRENPAMIVIDAEMFAANGEAMITELRKRAEWVDVPILLLEDIGDEELKSRLLEERGAQDYVTKPFSKIDLQVRVRNLLRMKTAQERYATLFKSMDQGFCIVEVLFDEDNGHIDYRFLEINDAFEKQTGLVDARGKRMRELAPDHEQHWFDIYGNIALTGEPSRFEKRASALGRWYEVYAFRVGRAENRHVAIFFNDISQRKQAEESALEGRQRLHLALSAGQLGDWSWDANTDIVTLNSRAAEIFGLGSEATSMTRTDMRELLHPEDRDLAQVALDAALANQRDYHVTYRIQRGQRQTWISAWARGTYINGSITGLTGVLQDVTAPMEIEEALRRSEEELRALANSIPQLAWMTEPNGDIFWYNQRWYEYTGTTLDEMRGWGWEKVHHPEHLSRVVHIWQAALTSGQPWEDTFPLRGENGVYRWFLSRAYPIRDADGNITRWFGTNTDVDEVKATQDMLQEESRILEILNKTGTAIASELDLERLVQIVTDAATELSGAKFGAFFYNTIGENGEALVLYTLSGAPRSAFEMFGLPRNTPVFNPTFTGQGVVRSNDITQDPRYGRMGPHHGMPAGHLPVRSYLAVSVTSRSGETIGGLFFGHPEPNIFTERVERLIVGVAAQAAIGIDNAQLYEARKKAQDALSQAHEQLEIRVAERTARLSDAVAQMEEFSYTVSHDLRAPLRGMQAYSQALLEDCGELLAERPHAIEHLQRIADNASRLDKMALDVLTFSRVTRGELRLAPVDLDKLVRDLVEHYASMQAPEAEIHIEPLMPVIGHEPSLTQIMSNLLSNAIKFVPPGTIPTIRVWTEQRDEEVRIWVEDSGVGIDPRYQHRLFRMFERIHPDSNYHGTGVGLAVVRKAADRMHGTVGVESDGQSGSRFWVQLGGVSVK